MKKTFTSLVVAGMIVNAVPAMIPMNAASAATVQQVKTTSTQTISVDGLNQTFTTIKLNGRTLYSAKDIARYLKAMYMYDAKTKTYKLATKESTVTFKGQANYIVSKNKKISTPIISFNRHMFMDLEVLVSAMGGDVITNEKTKTKFIATKGLVAGSFSSALMINNSQVLFTSEDSKAYLLDVSTKKVVKQFTIEEMSTSPDGKMAIYTDEKSNVYLLDFKTGKSTQISSDESFKSEFNWTADGTKVFFLQGEKGEVIAKMSVADGTITKVLDDKVEYKENLVIAADGSKVLYSAARPAETKYTDSSKSEVDTIITEGTEPQIFSFDTVTADSKPVALTDSKDNKFITALLSNGYVLYLAEDVEVEDKLPELKLISQDGKAITTLVSTKQIDLVKVTAKGSVYLLVTEANGSSSMYKLDVNTKKLERKLNTTQVVTSFDVSDDEKQIIATVETTKGEKVTVLKNGSLEALTKN